MKYYYVVEGDFRNNIGDVLQGMVAQPYLPKTACAADRENLRNLPSDEPAVILANGWYMHNFNTFPPPEICEPIYISVHIADSQMLKIERIRDHFRKHAPIGCRDKKTEKLFLGWGIPAYYSGCLTVTTKAPVPISKKSGEALLVDNIDHMIPAEVKTHIEKLLGKELIRLSHNPEITTGSFDSYVENGMSQMNTLLKRYCEADVIITTKIHCALPCLGMGANVILIHPNPSDPRLNTVREFMEIYSFDEVIQLKELKRKPVNTSNLINRQDFLKRIAEDSVSKGSNIIKTGSSWSFLKIRTISFIKAKFYRFVIKALLLLSPSPQIKKVYGKK